MSLALAPALACLNFLVRVLSEGLLALHLVNKTADRLRPRTAELPNSHHHRQYLTYWRTERLHKIRHLLQPSLLLMRLLSSQTLSAHRILKHSSRLPLAILPTVAYLPNSRFATSSLSAREFFHTGSSSNPAPESSWGTRAQASETLSEPALQAEASRCIQRCGW